MRTALIGRDHRQIETSSEHDRRSAEPGAEQAPHGEPWSHSLSEPWRGWWCTFQRWTGMPCDGSDATDRDGAPIQANGHGGGPPNWGYQHWRRGAPWHRTRWWASERREGPLRREMQGRVVGGVAAGLSRRLGIDRSVIRAVFVLSTLTGGLGFAAYVLAWLFLPAQGEQENVAARAIRDRRGIALALALVPLLTITLITASVVGAGWLATVAWPVFISAGGLVLIWRNVSAEERVLLEQELAPLGEVGTRGSSRRGLLLRVVLGMAATVVGVVLLTHSRSSYGLAHPLIGLVLVAMSIVTVFGPWWLHVARDLVDERQARARAEERADMASRVHDSVLQTLALIQRRADDPQEIVKLARAQERELRSWLFEGRVPGERRDQDDTMSAAVERLQREVEATHGVPVEAVMVGDCHLDDDLRSLVDAGREATVNAAKWSGASEVSLFVEVDVDAVVMYVRDRGKGFDEASVAPDRRGLSESIRGRMARHGGTTVVKSSAGEGTEITLTMAREK